MLIGLAAAEVREHRIGLQGDGAAVRFDGAERLIVGKGGGSLVQEGAVIPIARGGLVGQGGDDGPPGQQDGGRKHPFHPCLS